MSAAAATTPGPATGPGAGRLVVVGGAASLEVAPDRPLLDEEGFPEAYRPEALAQQDVLWFYRDIDDPGLDWTYISPAPEIGPGERTGHYRIGGDTLLTAEGRAAATPRGSAPRTSRWPSSTRPSSTAIRAPGSRWRTDAFDARATRRETTGRTVMRRVPGDATTQMRSSRVPDRPLPWLRGRHAIWALPALLLVLIVLGDLWSDRSFRMIAWVVMVPALTAALAGVGATALFSVLSVGAYVLIAWMLRPGPETGLPGLLLVAAAGVVSVGACAVRGANERRTARLSLAADVVRDTVLRPCPTTGAASTGRRSMSPPTTSPGSAGTSTTSSRAGTEPGSSSATCRARAWGPSPPRPYCSAPSARPGTTRPGCKTWPDGWRPG
ncbi:hypothetical protein OIM90_16110 [Streptomyces sp. AD16]|nr:hypothetical protein OIM90_16110 [Streptomyces sp. AD16]